MTDKKDFKVVSTEENIDKVEQLTPRENQAGEVKTALGDDLYDFYFNPDMKSDVRDILADCISKDKWTTLVDKFKEGKVDKEDFLDTLILSHFQAEDNANPYQTAEEVLERTVDVKLKGRLGRKLIGSLVDKLEAKNLLVSPEEARKLLSSGDVKQDLKGDYKKDNKKRTDVNDHEMEDESIEDTIMEEMNMPEVVVDRIRDINFDEAAYKIRQEDSEEFDIIRNIVFDFGFERISKHGAEKTFCFYVQTLDRVFVDPDLSNEKEAERAITRYLVRNEDGSAINPKQANELVQLFKQKYLDHFNMRLDTGLSFYDLEKNPDKVAKLTFEDVPEGGFLKVD